jgi:excisionase family DNA binding protein
MSENVIKLPKRLTPKELAEIWGVSARTVNRLCKAGKLRAVPLGNLFRIPPDAVLEYEERYGTKQFTIEQVQRYKPRRRAQ